MTTENPADKRSLAIQAIEGWQRNHMTTFTPSNILSDFGGEILSALRRTPAGDDMCPSPICPPQDQIRTKVGLFTQGCIIAWLWFTVGVIGHFAMKFW